MAYNNNNGDVMTLSAKWVEGKNGRGEATKYFSFTVPTGRKDVFITYRVYADSTYTPKSGKHSGEKCCPVRATRWERSVSTSNKKEFFS